VLAIAAYSAHTVVRPRRTWQPQGWQPPEHDLEDVRFQNDAGASLHGWLLPPAPGKGLVLICHGFGTNRREGQDLLPWLHAEGYGALLFDFRAHGESAGRFTTVGLREVDDLLAGVRFLQERFGPDVPLAGAGLSMGASVLIMAAARCGAIRAVVADSAFATLQRAVSRSFRVFFRLPPRLFTRPTIWWAERFTGGRVGSVMPILSVAQIAPRPLLLVQGTADRIVDPEDSLLLYQAAEEPKSLWRIEDGGHVQARFLYPEEYRRRLLDCLRAGLEVRGPQPAVAVSTT
jgi:fermentation-respiration switch protein FrsA (DUF1100 family)